MRDILKFLLPILKPYKWWYIIILQAPIIGSFYYIVNNYSIKLIVDIFAKNNVEYGKLLYPVSIYIGSIILIEFIWRISRFAWMKTQPFINANITISAFRHVQNHSYSFFITTPNGIISSKIKGIVDDYNALLLAIHSKMTSPLLQTLATLIALFFLNIWIFIVVAIWSVIFSITMIYLSKKVGRLSNIATESKYQSFGYIADNITNIFSIFSFSRKKNELNKISSFLMEDTAQKDYQKILLEIKSTIIGTVLYICMLIFLFILMIYLHKKNVITSGSFVFVLTLTYNLANNIWKVVKEVGDFIAKIEDFKASCSIIIMKNNKIDKKDSKILII